MWRLFSSCAGGPDTLIGWVKWVCVMRGCVTIRLCVDRECVMIGCVRRGCVREWVNRVGVVLMSVLKY